MKLLKRVNRALRAVNLKLLKADKHESLKARAAAWTVHLKREQAQTERRKLLKAREAALAGSVKALQKEVDRMTIESLYQINRIRALRQQLERAMDQKHLLEQAAERRSVELHQSAILESAPAE